MYSNAQYLAVDGVNTSISCEIDGVLWFVPLDPANTDYQNIMFLVGEAKIVIAPAEAT